MKRLIFSFMLFVTLGMAAGTSQAAGILTPTGSKYKPVEIRDHHVNVVINNGFAMTEVHQTFYNPNADNLEAVYSFPLPKSASLSEVTIYAGEREINGEVLEKQKARQIYQDEKSRGNDTGLAEKNEFYTFDFKVYPVPARDETKIRFLYYQPLKIENGIGRYLYPLEDGGTDEAGMSFWTNNARVENTFTMNLELKSAYQVQDVRTPGFEAAAQIDRLTEGHLKLDMQLSDFTLNRDFIFYYRLENGLPGRIEVLPYRADSSEDGTFMMVITPGVDLKPLANGADYCFVLDVSGSMQSKLHTLKKGVMNSIEKLQVGDRYRFIAFSSQAGEDKTYVSDFKFPDLDTDNPELERLWALATIEKLEAHARIGQIPPAESETAIKDLGLSYQIVTDYTSMVVLSDSAFADRGIQRLNQQRTAREHQARAIRSQQPVKSHRVDDKKPAFKFKAPSLGGGGGAIDPLGGGLTLLFSTIAAVRLLIRKRK